MAVETETPAQDYRLVIGDCVGRGWALVKRNLGILLVGTLLVSIAQGAIQAPGSVGRILIHFGRSEPALVIAGLALAAVSGIAVLILSGPLTGGLHWANLRLLRGEQAGVGDFFAGFTRGFGRLALCQVMMALFLASLLLLPMVVVGVGVAMRLSGRVEGVVMLAGGGVLLAAALAAFCYLAVCWLFAVTLIVDKQMGWWPAMKLSKRQVGRHWWAVFGLSLVAGLIVVAGLLACCVGILFTLPVAVATLMSGYEVIFSGSRPMEAPAGSGPA